MRRWYCTAMRESRKPPSLFHEAGRVRSLVTLALSFFLSPCFSRPLIVRSRISIFLQPRIFTDIYGYMRILFFNHGFLGFSRMEFSRQVTKNNSLREHRSAASSIRLKAGFQQMPDLHPYWLHQLFLVTRSAKTHLRCYAKPCGL